MSLKLLVDTKGQIVLYAEDSFADFLFNLLSLLVGTVIKLLRNKARLDPWQTFTRMLKVLSETCIQPTTNKDTLLKPKVSSYGTDVPLLLPNIQSYQRLAKFIGVI